MEEGGAAHSGQSRPAMLPFHRLHCAACKQQELKAQLVCLQGWPKQVGPLRAFALSQAGPSVLAVVVVQGQVQLMLTLLLTVDAFKVKGEQQQAGTPLACIQRLLCNPGAVKHCALCALASQY